MAKGIDVSAYNGNCDFNRAKRSGVDFVIIRAGTDYSGEDKYWVSNYKKAKAAGLGVGAYWYCYAKNVPQAVASAKRFLKSLEGMQFDYPVYLDLEDQRAQGGLGNKLRTDIAVAFLSELEKDGYYAGIYSMKSWFDNSFDMNRLARFDIWIARWGVQKHGYTGKGSVGMWQYTNRGRWSGIHNTGEGGVDSNISYKDYPALIKRAGLNNYKKEKENEVVKMNPNKKTIVLYLNDGDETTARYVAEMKDLEFYKDDGTRTAADYNIIYVGGQGENRFKTAKYVIDKWF